MEGSLFDIRRYSIHDGPGIRTTVFLKGCPLRCLWCHNPEGQHIASELLLREDRCVRCGACVDACPNSAVQTVEGELVTDRSCCEVCGKCVEVCYAEARQLTGRRMTVAEVVAEIEKDRVFYDQSGGGVTFSGGEPLVQRDFLLACLKACQERGLHTALDTCGSAPWEAFETVRPYVDLFLYDLKLVDDDRHRLATGSGSRLILDNLRCLAEQGSNLILRFPLIPGVNDDQENLQATAAFAASLPGLKRLDVLPYHHSSQGKYAALGRSYPLIGVCPPDRGRVEAVIQFFESCHLTVKLGG